jgi:hypothetical protein
MRRGGSRRSKCHPVLASKTTDFFNSFNNARDFTVSPQKGAEVMPDVRKIAVALLLAWARSA